MKIFLGFLLFVVCSSVLYGIDDTDPNFLQLLRINPQTAESQEIGPRYEAEIIGFKTGVNLAKRLLYVITWNATIPYINGLDLDTGVRKVHNKLDFPPKQLVMVEGMHVNQKTGHILMLVSYFDPQTIRQKQQRSVYVVDDSGSVDEQILHGDYLNMTHLQCDEVNGCPTTFDYDKRIMYVNYRMQFKRQQYVLGFNIDSGEQVQLLENNVDLSTMEYDEKNKHVIGIGYDTGGGSCQAVFYYLDDTCKELTESFPLDKFFFINPEVSAISFHNRHYYVQGSQTVFSPDNHLIQIDLDAGKVLNSPLCTAPTKNALQKCVNVMQSVDKK